MLRVLTLSSLFPDASRPRFGPFVERQTMGLAAHPDVELRVIAPLGIPPAPIGLHPKYRALKALPVHETWQGLDVYRPRYAHIPGVGGRFDGAALSRALLPLLRSLRSEFPFDVIDASYFFPDGPAAAALGKALGVPVSIKARGSDIHYWGDQPKIREQIRSAAHDAAGLLAVSAALKADMVAMGMAPEKIRVHYTGVDLDLFTPQPREAGAPPLIVCVGNLLERKGQGLLIDALTFIEGAQLALIGQGPDLAKLQARAAAAGVADRVQFVGSIAHAEMAEWLGKADVMALVSASEGLANAWVEALASGTPVVTTDVGGAREVINRPEAGRLVAADPAQIAAAITDILAHPPAADAVRACAQRFTWAANTASLYAHLSALAI